MNGSDKIQVNFKCGHKAEWDISRVSEMIRNPDFKAGRKGVELKHGKLPTWLCPICNPSGVKPKKAKSRAKK